MPKGWVWTTIDSLSFLNPGLQNKELSDDYEVSFLPMKNVEELTGKIDLSITKRYSEVKKGFTSFIDGDIIFAKITPCMENGKIAIVGNLKNGIGFGSTEFHVIRLLEEIENKFIFFYVVRESFRKNAQQSMAGAVGQQRVPLNFIANSRVAVPPLPEQKCIVSKIEELFPHLDEGVSSLKKAKLELKCYRQSVLKAAFEGRLTEKWREAHKKELEPASVLLERIKVERKQKLGKKYKELSSLEAEDSRNLSNTWALVRFIDIVSHEKNSIKRGPFGSAIKKSFFVEKGYKVYEQRNAIYDDCTLGNYYLDDRKFKELEDFEVKPGDFIISCSGTIGKIAEIPESAEKGVINQALLKITIEKRLILPKLFKYLFSSLGFQNKILVETRGSAMKNISSVEDIKKFQLAIPSIQEQNQIILEIERRFTIADNIEKTIGENLKKTERLRQSILKQAFEGKLVSQDPSDEPASVLLERIKQEKARLEEEKKRSRKKGKKRL